MCQLQWGAKGDGWKVPVLLQGTRSSGPWGCKTCTVLLGGNHCWLSYSLLPCLETDLLLKMLPFPGFVWWYLLEWCRLLFCLCVVFCVFFFNIVDWVRNTSVMLLIKISIAFVIEMCFMDERIELLTSTWLLPSGFWRVSSKKNARSRQHAGVCKEASSHLQELHRDTLLLNYFRLCPVPPAATVAWKEAWYNSQLSLQSLNKEGRGINLIARIYGVDSATPSSHCILLLFWAALWRITVPPRGINNHYVSVQGRWLIFPRCSSAALKHFPIVLVKNMLV